MTDSDQERENLELIRVLPDSVEFTPVGMKFNGEISMEDWTLLGPPLGRGHNAFKAALGDWLNKGEETFGDGHYQAVELTGLSYGSICNLKSIYKRVPFSLRYRLYKKYGYEFTTRHLGKIARLDAEMQEHMLVLAGEWQWTSDELGDRVKELDAIEAGHNSETEEQNTVMTEPQQNVKKVISKDVVYDKAVDVARAHVMGYQHILHEELNKLAILLEDEI